MLEEDETTDMPDRMNKWVMLGGYGIGFLLIFLMFALADPTYS